MAVVSLKIGARSYKFSCNDGQEAHMTELARELDRRAEHLTKTIGFMQEGQLLAMICLLLAEEKRQLEKNGQPTESMTDSDREVLKTLAEKISLLAESLNA